MSLHRIRLRGPWDVRPRGAAHGKAAIPATLRDCGLANCVGPVSFHRAFGKPTNLAENERVLLIFEDIIGAAKVQLNGARLGEVVTAAQFDVTQELRERNELVVELEAVDDQCGIVGEVVLEIRG